MTVCMPACDTVHEQSKNPTVKRCCRPIRLIKHGCFTVGALLAICLIMGCILCTRVDAPYSCDALLFVRPSPSLAGMNLMLLGTLLPAILSMPCSCNLLTSIRFYSVNMLVRLPYLCATLFHACTSTLDLILKPLHIDLMVSSLISSLMVSQMADTFCLKPLEQLSYFSCSCRRLVLVAVLILPRYLFLPRSSALLSYFSLVTALWVTLSVVSYSYKVLRSYSYLLSLLVMLLHVVLISSNCLIRLPAFTALLVLPVAHLYSPLFCVVAPLLSTALPALVTTLHGYSLSSGCGSPAMLLRRCNRLRPSKCVGTAPTATTRVIFTLLIFLSYFASYTNAMMRSETERDAIKLTFFDGVRAHFQTWRWSLLRFLMANSQGCASALPTSHPWIGR